MRAAWVIGGGGLLGSALSRCLREDGHQLYVPEFRFQWNDDHVLGAQLECALGQFCHFAQQARQWAIYWAAGIGTMHNAASSMVGETEALRRMVQRLVEAHSLPSVPGRFALASSAGAIYAGSTDPIITELSAPEPTTAYARAKLEQESIVHRLSREMTGMTTLAARVSTLYGSDQVSNKKQGLLTSLSRHIVRGLPIQIYVPLDTIRDYIHADDAARTVVDALNAAPRDASTTRIVAAELPTTISEIVGIFRRVAKRPPRIITSARQSTALYSRRIQFRSIVRPGLQLKNRVNLVVGIARLLEAERARFTAGDK